MAMSKTGLRLLAVAVAVFALVQVEATEVCNIDTDQLAECLPAVTGKSPSPPTRRCCEAIRHGKEPVVIARAGFSGMYPDSSILAYKEALNTSVPDVVVWCDVQLTKDGAGICHPYLWLQNSTDITQLFPDRGNAYVVNGTNMIGISENRCLGLKDPPAYMRPSEPGVLLGRIPPPALPPPQAPLPSLVDSDVAEPPFPAVTASVPPPPPGPGTTATPATPPSGSQPRLSIPGFVSNLPVLLASLLLVL
ncbi:hypothetical protein SAY86_003723 [Trapa natans]|uniref:glycerophosphodiester phosphodiesterase n=1 Tax=Trapa natans TaxID=22666 RepID=A0AAN7MHJ8_TRANT|nr:hypothetical protein SAY86_003723 [Trapa natans]